MAPALRHGDHLLVRMTGAAARSRPGSVVLVRLPERPLAVKRLVRLEPDGGVWVEGDNAFGSADSRTLGPIPPEHVTGRVLLRLWPRPGHVPSSH